jgi:ubiquinone/menaquinone biosynthesis C-methylase UbiE
MTLRSIFLQSPDFYVENNIFYQRDFKRPNDFEVLYLLLRKKENRVYGDDIVKTLPEVPPTHPLTNEWQFRKFSSQNLLRYLTTKKDNPKILELGCGNGWLSHKLATLPHSEVVGVDINEQELLQASRVFGKQGNISFAYADINNVEIHYSHFDYIILSASLQYFGDLTLLFSRLFSLLKKKGEIHILDTPVYQPADVHAAHERSERYFTDAGFAFMSRHYHHHNWEILKRFTLNIQYNPHLLLNRIKRKFSRASPFPWIIITA